MAHVYQNIIIGNRQDVGPNGRIVTTAKGQLVSDNGTRTTAQAAPTADNQFLASDTTQSTGLIWRVLTPADIPIVAGLGLTQTGSVIDVGASTTIFANANNVIVNSSAIANQTLLSSGTPGTEAVFGALPLNDSNAVTGTLPFANGGTGASTFATGNRLVATNVANNALVATNINPDDIFPSIVTTTTTNATPTSAFTIPTVNDTSYTVSATIIARDTASPFDTASFTIGATFNNIGGTLTQVGGFNNLVYVPITTTWFAEAVVSGTDIDFVVTGAAGITVDWKARIDPVLSIA